MSENLRGVYGADFRANRAGAEEPEVMISPVPTAQEGAFQTPPTKNRGTIASTKEAVRTIRTLHRLTGGTYIAEVGDGSLELKAHKGPTSDMPKGGIKVPGGVVFNLSKEPADTKGFDWGKIVTAAADKVAPKSPTNHWANESNVVTKTRHSRGDRRGPGRYSGRM